MTALAIDITVSLIAFLHFYFLLLEMYFWTKPIGLKTFQMSKDRANETKVLALNQGLYNGFLAIGLLWSVFETNLIFKIELQYFFLGCVFIAGIVGALSVNRKIFYIQGLPALIALFLKLLI